MAEKKVGLQTLSRMLQRSPIRQSCVLNLSLPNDLLVASRRQSAAVQPGHVPREGRSQPYEPPSQRKTAKQLCRGVLAFRNSTTGCVLRDPPRVKTEEGVRWTLLGFDGNISASTSRTCTILNLCYADYRTRSSSAGPIPALLRVAEQQAQRSKA